MFSSDLFDGDPLRRVLFLRTLPVFLQPAKVLRILKTISSHSHINLTSGTALSTAIYRPASSLPICRYSIRLFSCRHARSPQYKSPKRLSGRKNSTSQHQNRFFPDRDSVASRMRSYPNMDNISLRHSGECLANDSSTMSKFRRNEDCLKSCRYHSLVFGREFKCFSQ